MNVKASGPDLPELRNYIRQRRRFLADLLEEGAVLELDGDLLRVIPRNDIYIRYLNDRLELIGELASELYVRKLSVKVAVDRANSATGQASATSDIVSAQGVSEPQTMPGADAIRDAIANARPATLDAQSEIARLAKLLPFEYERERKGAAKRLRVRPAALDAMVKQARKQPASSAVVSESLAPPPPEAWPEPVNDAAALLDELRDFIARFVVVAEEALTAIVLWIAFTYLFEIAETSPRLAIVSPTKRCGKTRLLELLALLCPRPVSASNLTPSAVYRLIDAERATLLIDEADTFTRENDELRGLLNSGHTRATAYVVRSVPFGDGWLPKRFSTWTPIAVAAIGFLPDTWLDRSIEIRMKRKIRSQRVERLTLRSPARDEAAVLARKLARFATDNLNALASARPAPLDALDDRANDNFELLLAIADAAGEWADRSRRAALALSANRENDNSSLGEALLADINRVVNDRDVDRIGSTELVEALIAIEPARWAEIGRARKSLTPARLARMLKPFGIFPYSAAARNEYAVANFEDAFSRYLTIPPDQRSKGPQTAAGVKENLSSEVPLDGNLKGEEIPTERTIREPLEVSNEGISAKQGISPPESPDANSAVLSERESKGNEEPEFLDDDG